MPKSRFPIKSIKIVDLILDVKNPRFEDQDSQRQAIQKMVDEIGLKLFNLAEHITKNNTSPIENLIVTKSKSGKKYIVLEGNRRIAAMKLATEAQLVNSLDIPKKLADKFRKLNSKSSSIPTEIYCAVAPSRKAARPWIELRHTGENDGVGVINWNGVATARFRGYSPEFLFVELVKASAFLDTSTRDRLEGISLTNIQRLLNSPAVRKEIGVRVKNKQLSLVDDSEETLGRMAMIVSDIANKYIKVSQIDTIDQRVSYAKRVMSRPAPKKGERIPAPPSDGQGTRNQGKGSSKSSKGKARKTLIPRALKLNISQSRISEIFGELKKLDINTYTNSSAVLLRVFLEMSLNEYAQRKRISFDKSITKSGKTTKREMHLKEKADFVIDELIKKDPNCRPQMHGIKTQIGTKNTIFSITNWQQYVHNADYHPIASELKRIWDNIQPLFERIWA